MIEDRLKLAGLYDRCVWVMTLGFTVLGALSSAPPNSCGGVLIFIAEKRWYGSFPSMVTDDGDDHCRPQPPSAGQLLSAGKGENRRNFGPTGKGSGGSFFGFDNQMFDAVWEAGLILHSRTMASLRQTALTTFAAQSSIGTLGKRAALDRDRQIVALEPVAHLFQRGHGGNVPELRPSQVDGHRPVVIAGIKRIDEGIGRSKEDLPSTI